MGESQRSAVLYIGLDLFVVQRRLVLIWRQDHHDVSAIGSGADGCDGQTGRLGLRPATRALTQSNHNLDTGLFEIIGVGVPLRTVADHCDLTRLNKRKIRILIVVNIECHMSEPLIN